LIHKPVILKSFPSLYEPQIFTSICARTRYWSLCWATRASSTF
jgi:hypothetical protein